ncbi:MAG: hypothetical protein QM803_08400 [Rhodocyclaceae bacterium]
MSDLLAGIETLSKNVRTACLASDFGVASFPKVHVLTGAFLASQQSFQVTPITKKPIGAEK